MRLGLSALIFLILLAPAFAQPQNNGGFTVTVPLDVSGQEVLEQPNLWVMEVSYKPVRMIRVDITDPVSKAAKQELVWYLVWKATVKPVAPPTGTEELRPVNVEDELPTPLFIPEFRLVAEDNNMVTNYPEEILPEAHAAIVRREEILYPTNLQSMQELPAEGKTVYGVATWKNIDPRVDYFSIQMLGFSNGYRLLKDKAGNIIEDENGKPLRLRRVIVQKYWRPGDEYDETENEIRYDGKPSWQYIPEPADALPPKPDRPYEEEPSPLTNPEETTPNQTENPNPDETPTR